MKIESKALVEEFIREYGDAFPEVKSEQYIDILYGPWRYLKNIMETGTLTSVRFKYFGIFKVHDKRKEYLNDTLEIRYNKGLITEDKFKITKKIFDDDKNKSN